ncbi:MAG: hypothetical protein NXI20_28800, partial [bacterium]|nr:hypothetical protein [bacterium]
SQTVTVEEYNIYGSSREGQIKTSEVVWQNGQPNVSNTGIHQNTLGERSYEVTNHLGNVLAVITDRNTVVDSTYEAVVIMTSDYYPFGMVMPGRNWTASGAEAYRYAYNGMEQDNEVSGNGNSYTTEFRQYDPRLGRWKSLDPLMKQFPYLSPYCAFDNNPIFYVDPYGLASEGGPGGPPEEDFVESLLREVDDYIAEEIAGYLNIPEVEVPGFKQTWKQKLWNSFKKKVTPYVEAFFELLDWWASKRDGKCGWCEWLADKGRAFDDWAEGDSRYQDEWGVGSSTDQFEYGLDLRDGPGDYDNKDDRKQNTSENADIDYTGTTVGDLASGAGPSPPRRNLGKNRSIDDIADAIAGGKNSPWSRVAESTERVTNAVIEKPTAVETAKKVEYFYVLEWKEGQATSERYGPYRSVSELEKNHPSAVKIEDHTWEIPKAE